MLPSSLLHLKTIRDNTNKNQKARQPKSFSKDENSKIQTLTHECKREFRRYFPIQHQHNPPSPKVSPHRNSRRISPQPLNKHIKVQTTGIVISIFPLRQRICCSYCKYILCATFPSVKSKHVLCNDLDMRFVFPPHEQKYIQVLVARCGTDLVNMPTSFLLHASI